MIRGRLLDIVIGLVYLLVIAALVLLSIAVFQHRFTTYVTVSANTSSIGNSLADGSEVKVRGVLVGEVGGVSTDGKGARLSLNLYPGQVRTLPANMTVQLLPMTLFGERYVNLVLPAHPAGSLHSGLTLQQDRDPGAIELEQLFSDLLPVLQAVQPDKLAASLGEVAAALRGRGKDIGDTLAEISTYFTALTPHIPQLTDDLRRLSTVATNYTTAAPTLLQGLQALTTTSQTLVRQRQDVDSLIGQLTHTGTSFGTLVGDNQQQIIGLAADSRAPLQILRRYATEFPCLARALVDYEPTADKALGKGTRSAGLHVNVRVVPAAKAYTADDRPNYSTSAGPSCPYTPANGLAATALANTPGIQGADSASTDVTRGVAGLGTANSPQENHLIAELVAADDGTNPSSYPGWSSLLLGPALRGTQVRLR